MVVSCGGNVCFAGAKRKKNETTLLNLLLIYKGARIVNSMENLATSAQECQR